MMTRKQKIEWLAKASHKQVIEQLRWAVDEMHSENIDLQMAGQEDYELITAEMLRRMKR